MLVSSVFGVLVEILKEVKKKRLMHNAAWDTDESGIEAPREVENANVFLPLHLILWAIGLCRDVGFVGVWCTSGNPVYRIRDAQCCVGH
jgi:hypothetical protein